MAPITSYRQLEVWQKSIDLVERCHMLVDLLPRNRQFILGDQILRAAVSIPANIAEGQRRPHRAYLNHLSIALGSQAELETHLEIARRLNLLTSAEISATLVLVESVGQMLHALTRSLERL